MLYFWCNGKITKFRNLTGKITASTVANTRLFLFCNFVMYNLNFIEKKEFIGENPAWPACLWGYIRA